MTYEEIETRMNEILTEMDTEGADIKALTEEVRNLNAQKAELRKAAEEAEKRREDVANGAGTVIETREETENKEDKNMELRDLLNSKEYIDAYAEYIKSGNPSEVRSILTDNATATGNKIPVPTFLQSKIETAWEKNEILSRVNKTYVKGNLKVPFELSADDAVVHDEGSAAVAEENLEFGVVELIPETVKKWVSFSDETEAMRGQEFLDYIYDEIIYRVTKKLADLCVDDIVHAPAENSATAIGVPTINAAPGVTTIAEATTLLSEEATNLVVIMNRQTEADFIQAHAAGNFAVDPFAGLPRVYTSHLPAYTNESSAVYAIVGDLSGIQVNYPEGDDVEMKYDNMTRKKEDIVEVLGRQYAGHGVTKLGRFVNIKHVR